MFPRPGILKLAFLWHFSEFIKEKRFQGLLTILPSCMQGFGAVAVLNLAVMTGNVGGVRSKVTSPITIHFTYILDCREANKLLPPVSYSCEFYSVDLGANSLDQNAP